MIYKNKVTNELKYNTMDNSDNDMVHHNISDSDSDFDTSEKEYFCDGDETINHICKIKELHENDFPQDARRTQAAAFYGHLKCLKYAHENGCPWHHTTTVHLASNENIECLKYAYENGCPWDDRTTMYAAEMGNIECLKYAHENGCPWHDETIRYASNYGKLECLKYAYENGCPLDKENITYYKLGHEVCNIDCLKYLHKIGCRLHNNSVIAAYLCSNDEVFSYLLENGCEFDENLMHITPEVDIYNDDAMTNINPNTSLYKELLEIW
jgi:hypothetical protein